MLQPNRSFLARAVAWVLQRAAKLSIGCRSYGLNYLRDITISFPKVPQGYGSVSTCFHPSMPMPILSYDRIAFASHFRALLSLFVLVKSDLSFGNRSPSWDLPY